MSTISKDHEGRLYPAFGAMCRHWHINCRLVDARLNRGWSMEKALTTPVAKVQQSCVDHLGNEFTSYTAMCDHWGVRLKTFQERLNKYGYSLEYALTKDLRKTGRKKKPCVDHQGREFECTRDMCDYWGINVSTFRSRIRNRDTLESALTRKVEVI